MDAIRGGDMINNRAIVNECKEGWDDVEWLQNVVTRLRKDIKAPKKSVTANPTDSTALISFKLGHTPHFRLPPSSLLRKPTPPLLPAGC